MKRIRVAAAALNQTPLDWDGNKKNIIDAINEAEKEYVSLLCLPELCITGYGCEDAFQAPFVQDTAQAVLTDIVNETKNLNVIFSIGFPLNIGNALYNCVALIHRGKILGIVPKQHLAGDGIHYEPRWFKPWPKGQVLDSATGAPPIGDLIFNIKGIFIGFEICEDAWVVDRPGIDLSRRGADIILNPSASHFAFGKHEVRKRFVLEGSRSQNVTYVYSNLLGNEAGRAIYDGDTIIGSAGEIVACGERFSFKNYTLCSAIVDVDKTRVLQTKLASFKPVFSDGCVVASVAQFNEHWSVKTSNNKVAPQIFSKEEEFSKAAILGLWDYMRKSHSNGFMLSLSGGADSSACAVLVRMMYDKLKENKLHKTSFNKVLTCVYQRTKNSSEDTFQSAKVLAESIDANFINWSVDDVIDCYCDKVAKSIGLSDTDGKKLNWEEHDIALQNIQARARVPGIWMLANINNSLLITTSNRSEAAVGYTSLDGDSAGGLAPIAGIDKAFILKWLSYVYYNDKIKWRGMQSVVESLIPTAELRPSDKNQSDEDDLMPYAFLDQIEKLAIRDKKSPIETYELLLQYNNQVIPEQAKRWVIKFYSLFARNQFKRERFAVSFHYDDENLDPKSWCRFPVLNSGFKEELDYLRKIDLESK
jgi:NAD+ synthase (glutamine-hydrolysing)